MPGLTGPLTTRHYWALALTMFATQIIWAALSPLAYDWDGQHYLAVARKLAEGEPAQSLGVWSHALAPEALPAPADWHWSWLPSRILVPGLWLSERWGHVPVSACLGSVLPPAAAWFAGRLGATAPWALGAGVLAIAGGGYQPMLAGPDCYALFGAIGSVGLWAALKQRWWIVILMAALAGITRNDGIFLAAVFAALVPGWRKLLVLGASIASTAAWLLVNHLQLGDAFWKARALAFRVTDYDHWWIGAEQPPLALQDRLELVVSHSTCFISLWLGIGMFSLTAFAFVAAWTHRRTSLARVWWAAITLVPAVSLLLAPVIASHGSYFRFHAAFHALDCAMIALGASSLARWSHGWRKGRYHPFILVVICALYGQQFLTCTSKAIERINSQPELDFELISSLPPGAPVFSSNVLRLDLECGRPAVHLHPKFSPERAREVAIRYGVRHAFVTLDDRARSQYTDGRGSLFLEDAKKVLPGWTLVGDWLLVAPDSWPSTDAEGEETDGGDADDSH